jgi:hypothetical protein
MTILKRVGGILIVSAATAAVVSLSAAPALAATFSVTPGGSFSFSGSGQVKDQTTGTVAHCTINLSGTLKSGHGLSGAGIGSITSASFASCTIATISVSVAVHGLPWKENVTGVNATTGTVKGNISGIDLVASAPGCSATLDGTAAGANNGKTNITYSDKTGVLTLLGNGNLHSWAVSGCFGLLNNGDVQKASGSGSVTPKQTITSP